jgi:hypothetical protein
LMSAETGFAPPAVELHDGPGTPLCVLSELTQGLNAGTIGTLNADPPV